MLIPAGRMAFSQARHAGAAPFDDCHVLDIETEWTPNRVLPKLSALSTSTQRPTPDR
jgi:hypothetical protein